MVVMLPVMLAARKLDGEDENVVFLLRCVYGAVQSLAVIFVLYVYVKASAAAKQRENATKIYVPSPPQPFNPDAKASYTEKLLGEHLKTTARGLVGSTIFGIIMTVGFHMWKGMIVGLAIQSVMCPFNLAENALFYNVIWQTEGLGNLKKRRIFDEKLREDLTDDDEVVDGDGNKIVLKKKSFEEVLLDTWDLGADADIEPLMGMLNKKNINFATSDNGWTPIMIMSGLGAKSAIGAMRQMKAMGANPGKVDKEGWNALHWAAFHGSADAAKVLLSKDDYDGIALGLHEVEDKEGKTAVVHARDEGNDDVAKVIEGAVPPEPDRGAAGEGLRKRK